MSEPVNPLAPILASLPRPLERLEDYLAHWADQRPDALAAIDLDQAFSYRQLADRVAGWAGLLAGRGIGDGDRVALLAPPSVDFIATFLAATTLGATWVGLNPKYTVRELRHVLDDAAPGVLIARRVIDGRDFTSDIAAFRDEPAARNGAVVWLERADARLPDDGLRGAPTTARATNPIAALVYTSGTTGAPKGARLSHAALIRAAQVRLAVWPVTPLRLINNVPINHVGGLGDLACTALVGGGSQVFVERFTAKGTLDAIRRHGVTYWYQAPTMFEMCLSAPEAADMDWSSLQAVIWSGGRPSDSLVERLGELCPRLGVDYSMTESVGPISISPLCKAAEMRSGACGWPDPRRGIRIAADDLADGRRSGRVGEVQLRDPWIFAGYHGEGAPADTFAEDGWFRTGDLAMLEDDGALRLLGRSKEVFKSGGYSVYPREIELVLEAAPGVLAAAVVSVPNRLYGEVGAAFIAVDPDSFSMADLHARCREQLANYKIPKSIEVVDRMPMLAIGKIDRALLRAIALGPA